MATGTGKPSAATRGVMGSEKAVIQLAQLESKLELLTRKFNRYFNGFERVAPQLEFEAMKREMRDLQAQAFSTGQSRFKAQNLVARWQVHRSRWERDLARKEEGTFKPGASVAAMHPTKDDADDADGI